METMCVRHLLCLAIPLGLCAMMAACLAPAGSELPPAPTLGSSIGATPAEPAATPSVSADSCADDAGCVMALRIDRCCPCPEVVPAGRLAQDRALVLYELGKDYGPLLPAECGKVVCAPCPLPGRPACQDGKCVEVQESGE